MRWCLRAIALVASSSLASCVEEHPDWAGVGDAAGSSDEASGDGDASSSEAGSSSEAEGGDGDTDGGGDGDGDGGTTSSDTGPNPDEHLIFATTDMIDGAFGGLESADMICQMHATAGGLVGEFKALLSDDSNSAASRLTISGPVYNTANELVADGSDALWSGALTNPVAYTEFGVASMGPLWTGSTTSGTSKTTCENWTTNDNALFGSQGFRTSADFGWIDAGDDRCFKAKSLYCISQ